MKDLLDFFNSATDQGVRRQRNIFLTTDRIKRHRWVSGRLINLSQYTYAKHNNIYYALEIQLVGINKKTENINNENVDWFSNKNRKIGF